MVEQTESMKVIACPYCEAGMEEGMNFCAECERQVRCLAKDCGSLLRKGKSICLVCGTPIVGAYPGVEGQVNRYRLEENITAESSYRKIELIMSDQAVKDGAALLRGFLPSLQKRAGSQELWPPYREEGESGELGELVAGRQDGQPALPAPSSEDDATEDTRVVKGVLAAKYFDVEGDSLTVLSPDFKGEKRKDQQRNFILMFVWAYPQLHSGTSPTPSVLARAAKENGIFDGNFYNYMREMEALFLLRTDERYRLKPAGKQKVEEIRSLIDDPEIVGYRYWESKSRPGSGGRTLKSEKEKIQAWLGIESPCDNFAIRSLETATDHAMLALYDITKCLKVENAVKPGVAYEYLKARHKTISLERRTFRDALSRGSKGKDRRFGRTSEKLYFLTPEAEEMVKTWVNAGTKTQLSTNKK